MTWELVTDVVVSTNYNYNSPKVAHSCQVSSDSHERRNDLTTASYKKTM
jgi:hypothetical protein